MVQQENPQSNNKTLSFSEQLTQYIASEAFNMADVFGRAAQSYPQNRHKQHICIAIAMAVGIVIGAAIMYLHL